MQSRTWLCALLLCLSQLAPVYAGMYKWYDEDGNTHYTQLPPPPGAKQAPISPHINNIKSEQKPAEQQPTTQGQFNYNRDLNQSRNYGPVRRSGSTASSAETDKRILEWRRQKYQEKLDRIRSGNSHSGAATGR